jgi:hypothetical protein
LNPGTPKNKIKKEWHSLEINVQSTDPYCNRILIISSHVDEEIFFVKFKTFGAESIICLTTHRISITNSSIAKQEQSL